MRDGTIKSRRALRRRFQQNRRFDLDKTAFVKILADRRNRLRTHPDVVLQAADDAGRDSGI